MIDNRSLRLKVNSTNRSLELLVTMLSYIMLPKVTRGMKSNSVQEATLVIRQRTPSLWTWAHRL